MLAQKLPLPLRFSEDSNQVLLFDGSILLDSEHLTALVKNDCLVQTWPTSSWLLIGITRDERKAIFEADDSWILAILDLETGIWFADDDPLFIHYSLEQDEDGDFVLEEATDQKLYLK
jgi:hypothetical protein